MVCEMITKEDLEKKREKISEIKQSHREIEAATAKNSSIFVSIDYDAAKRDRDLGLVPDEEWERFLDYYGTMRSYHRIFSEGKQKEDHRELERKLEKQLEDMEKEYRAQNSISNRLKRFFSAE